MSEFRAPVLIEAPTDDVVTLEEAKAQLRIATDDTDDMISAVIMACVQQLDPAGGGWLGRALRPQTWELQLNAFPFGYCGTGYNRNANALFDHFRPQNEIELPYPPLIDMVSVKYDDRDGVEKTLVLGTDYRVFSHGVKTVLMPAYNRTWPSARYDHGSVRVRYTAGYPVDDPDTLPAPIKQAVLLMLRQLWALGERNLFVSAENIDGVGSWNYVVSDNANAVMKTASESLLQSYRVWE